MGKGVYNAMLPLNSAMLLCCSGYLSMYKIELLPHTKFTEGYYMTKKSNSKADNQNQSVEVANNQKLDQSPDTTKQDKSTTTPNSTVGIQNSTASGARVNVDEGMSDGVFGLIVLAILIALVTWAVVSVVHTDSTVYMLGELDYSSEGRVGDSVTLSYQLTGEVDNDTTVEWYVDDVAIDNYSYDGNTQLQYQWQPIEAGRHTVQLKVGNMYTDKAVLTIAKPLVVVDIDDITMQYGSDMPQLTYTVSGMLGSDSWQDIGCSGVVMCADSIDGVGIYTLTMSDTSCTSDSYELQCNSGNLIVAPRRVSVSNDIIKQYDGTNSIAISHLDLVGVVEGDDVDACVDMLYFCDKNVGADKQISTYNIELVGSDSCNYTIDGATICGTIVAKQLTVDGAKVDNKVYDGSTTANISYSGQLLGVVEGDSVAIGMMEARFQSAKIGKNKAVEVDNITLIGSDSTNYTVDRPTLQAKIVAKYIDLLTGNDAVAGDSTN